ncbi:YoaK family protein [Hydrogenophaga sp.]|uniref:YoaK family protein n=1 Tax=Hydrogenophaga sp. TaxID=1904254 RepID=UPI002731EA51|nr:YoaK family protein [Hydrogenophaga sp.]MDP2016452.1 YoaK family protein [Hydrogenophaga sp.]MDP3811804.1 YoaK family protein [Hydrogenophaga sp.]
MPANYARYLIGTQRTAESNRELGFVLAFVAGAINAGGFLAVKQYTSHVTGMVSSLADNLALGQLGLVVDAAVGVLSFLLGAMCCAIMVNFARRRRLSSEYALPLLLEAALILCFGLLGAQLSTFEGLLIPFTVVLLCFIMGLQNAVATKLSNAVIRTTHMTGIVTDLGIELGKLIYWNGKANHPLKVRADRKRMAVLAGLLTAFTTGGIAGAFGFKQAGYGFTVPLALVLAVLALVPTVDDLLRSRKTGP